MEVVPYSATTSWDTPCMKPLMFTHDVQARMAEGTRDYEGYEGYSGGELYIRARNGQYNMAYSKMRG